MNNDMTPDGYVLDEISGMYLPVKRKKRHRDEQTPEQRQAAIDKAVAKRLRKMEARKNA